MTVVVKDNGLRKLEFDPQRLINKLDSFKEGLDVHPDTFEAYKKGVIKQIQGRQEIDFRDINDVVIQNAIDRIMDFKDGEMMDFDKLGNTQFEFVAARALLNSLYKRASKNRSYDVDSKYGDYFGLLSSLGEQGLIEPEIFVKYTKEEIQELGKYIKPERDLLLTYAGLYNMSERYLIRAKDKGRSVFELPQERYMTIAISLLREETQDRLQHVKELYDVLSKQEVTMATPTFANAGRPDAQFSSCFILTTEDSLQGIYDDNTDAARLSKAGGGIGIYVGKIRAAGSDIRGNVGAAGGIVGWLKQLNNTAVSVDQLGVRSGAIAAYLDVWHYDIEDFLELRLNTGDLSKRAHELFLGASIPDLFMQQVEKRGDWYLFDPHEVKKVLGFSLEDFYDKEKWDGKSPLDPDRHAFSYHYFKAVDNNDLHLKKRLPAIEIMKKIMRSQLETGLPYMFYRDTANRDNPNNHAGMVYCSNLCSEIVQNQSPTIMTKETINELGEIIVHKQSGDFVTCNLSSIVLNNVLKDFTLSVEGPQTSDDVKAFEKLRQVLRTQVRATDAVITVNNLPVLQAQYTNNRYRAIGIGEQGIAAVLAKQGIHFDSVEATKLIARLEERIMLNIIEASADLAQEKGSYPLFEGSQWNTGEWLNHRGICQDDIEDAYRAEVYSKAKKGMRNGYLRAVAPTGSTSLLAGSTAAADTVYDTIFFDGKKDSRTPVIAPELSLETWFYYKPTMLMEFEGERDLGHMWAILHNAERQKWVDQSTSFNLYILDDIKVKNLLRLHMEVWSRGIKSSYYTRSHDASRVDDCVACSA